MKVTGPNSSQSAKSASRAKGGPATSTFNPLMPDAPVGGPSAARAAGPIASVDAVLALQSVGDFRESRRRAVVRGHDLLDTLDKLKIDLIDGAVPRARLTRLMDVLKTRRDASGDPKLELLLDEIELRAEVELAKLDTGARR